MRQAPGQTLSILNQGQALPPVKDSLYGSVLAMARGLSALLHSRNRVLHTHAQCQIHVSVQQTRTCQTRSDQQGASPAALLRASGLELQPTKTQVLGAKNAQRHAHPCPS